MANDRISTGLGEFSKEKFNALITVREAALDSIRGTLKEGKCAEVTTSSLVNIAGSCENPNASFTLNYYGREAHLSQSAQIQLEALVIRLKRGVFTVNNSFREENYDDPEVKGRRLSEFTLIESEKLYRGFFPQEAIREIIKDEKKVLKYAIHDVLKHCSNEITLLGGKVKFLERVLSSDFNIITYDNALELLNKDGKGNYKFGDDLNIKEERKILTFFENIPTFVTHYPASIKFFNMKRTQDGQRVYSVDLLMPKLGETVGGAVREENGEIIKKQLLESKIADFLRSKDQDPVAPFTEYFKLFEQEEPVLRGGYGIGFERFVGFLLGSNDILETIAYKTLQPGV